MKKTVYLRQIISKLVLLSLMIFLACSPKNTNKIAKKNTPKDVEYSNSTVKNDNNEIEKDIVYAFDFKKENLLSQVLNLAAAQNKLVFLDVGAQWCTPCKLMQRDVYTHSETAHYFNEHFINYKVDIDVNEGPDLKLIFDIKTVPTLLWLDQKGRVIYRKEGACYQKELLQNAEYALQKGKNN